jgi:hypothetical protein
MLPGEHAMNPARPLLLAAFAAAALACPAPAAAQWAWRDASGKMVYSDQPPPKSVPAKDLVRQPPAAPAPPARVPSYGPPDSAAEAKPAPLPTAASPRPPTVAEREIESRRRQQQLAEAEKKAADEEAQQAQAAQNCERLRAYQRALEGGHRIARVNAAGEKEILGDAQRASEVERTRSQIELQCR